MTNSHCKHCNGPCTNHPPMYPTTLQDRGPGWRGPILEENLYWRGEWAIDTYNGGYFHRHEKEIYCVLYHYWSPEQGWPVREAIHICSFCQDEMPPEDKKLFNAAHKFMNLGTNPPPWRRDFTRSIEILQYSPSMNALRQSIDTILAK